jgi:hypothetical protein
MIYLDFDGVFVDSAFEAFRIMMCTQKHIDSPFDNSADSYYDEFYKLRPYVGPAKNYYNVYNIIVNRKNIAVNDISSESIEFEKLFFETRKQYKQQNIDNWIGIHTLYDFSYKFCDLDIRFEKECCFLTNKNKEPVTTLLQTLLPKLSNIKVISMTEFDVHETKGTVLKKMPSDGFSFIDDSVEICEDVKLHNPSANVICAGWGYSTDCNKNNTKIPVHYQTNIFNKDILL